MAEEKPPKNAPVVTSASSLPSRSDSSDSEQPPLSRDQWLEILITRQTEAIEANTDGIIALKEIVETKLAEANKSSASSDRRSEERLAEIQILFTDFLERNAIIVDGVKQIAGATTKTSKSLQNIKQGVKAIRENTGRIPRYDASEEEFGEGDAPKSVRKIARAAGDKLANLIWPIAMRTGWRAVQYIFTAITGSALFAGVLKLFHFWLTHRNHS